MPPALAASSRQQQEFDYEFERQVIASDASTSFDAFLAKAEVRYHLQRFWQQLTQHCSRCQACQQQQPAQAATLGWVQLRTVHWLSLPAALPARETR